MTKDEALKKLNDNMTRIAGLILDLADAAEAIKSSPVGRQVVANAMLTAAGIRESEAFEALDAIAKLRETLTKGEPKGG